jgi:hypothetical protein
MRPKCNEMLLRDGCMMMGDHKKGEGNRGMCPAPSQNRPYKILMVLLIALWPCSSLAVLVKIVSLLIVRGLVACLDGVSIAGLVPVDGPTFPALVLASSQRLPHRWRNIGCVHPCPSCHIIGAVVTHLIRLTFVSRLLCLRFCFIGRLLRCAVSLLACFSCIPLLCKRNCTNKHQSGKN